MNPNYESIGQEFVRHFYSVFDDPVNRHNLALLYNLEHSLLTFEGAQFKGSVAIMEKLGSLSFQKIAHLPTKVDCQPMLDGGILVMVFGQLKTDDDPPHTYTQTFVLRPLEQSWFVAHDIFRLNLV